MKYWAFPVLLLLLLVKPALDPWNALVTEGASYDRAAAALGKPANSYPAVIVAGTRPIQIPLSVDDGPSFQEDGTAPPERIAVRVMRWRGVPGLDWILVLKDDKAIYAVAPPLEDEKDSATVLAKWGEVEAGRDASTVADARRAWETLDYPAKGLRFVRAPGETRITARVIYR